jgi:hypothetical protein
VAPAQASWAADAQQPDQPSPQAVAAQTTIAACHSKLEQYHAALDAGAGATLVAAWIRQVQAERA